MESLGQEHASCTGVFRRQTPKNPEMHLEYADVDVTEAGGVKSTPADVRVRQYPDGLIFATESGGRRRAGSSPDDYDPYKQVDVEWYPHAIGGLHRNDSSGRRNSDEAICICWTRAGAERRPGSLGGIVSRQRFSGWIGDTDEQQ